MNSLHVEHLPLVLAGPILRRTEPEAVTVWLALKQACQVQLSVRETFERGERLSERTLLSGQNSSIRLGEHLHLVAVTAIPYQSGRLEPDCLYAYDLSFRVQMAVPTDSSGTQPNLSFAATDISLQRALQSAGLPNLLISYFTHGLPTFALPPRDLSQLRIFHGSCRRIHDHEHDALPILDLAIAHAAHSPSTRPHQLFFTGDQIYGDEVAEPFLWGVLQMVQVLFGWQEDLPGEDGEPTPPQQLEPGQRQFIAEQLAGFTASHQGKPEKTRSHLLRFAEYAIAYLFAWSDCPWLLPFPSGASVGLPKKQAKNWDKQVADIQQFARSQPYVRRALANIPTYMICDDHDVSDDWNLNQAWCLRVLSKPLGRQVVQNAILAYALFQGWGNTPEQFTESGPGAQLLKATQQWCQQQGACPTSAQQIAQSLGLPPSDLATGFPQFQQQEDALALDHPTHSLQWHYRVRGTVHEVLVLDTRTQRGYPARGEIDALPQLLSPRAFEHQLLPLLEAAAQESLRTSSLPPVQLTLVVAPTNLFSLKILDHLQSLGHRLGKGFDIDIGDSWTLENVTRAKFLAYLLKSRQSIIVLSGDIHFAGTIHLDYWSRHWEADSSPQISPQISPQSSRYARKSRYLDIPAVRKHTLVQCTASAMCNSEPLTEVLHTRLKSLFPERARRWIGWENADEVEIGFGVRATLARVARSPFSLVRKLRRTLRRSIRPPAAPNTPPDWQYESYWVERQPATIPAWGMAPPWVSRQDHSIRIRRKYWLQRLWNTRCLQEGKEVIGFNNIGLVRLEHSTSGQSQANHFPDVVIHEVYWYAPWSDTPHVVCSQYRTNLLNSPFQEVRSDQAATLIAPQK